MLQHPSWLISLLFTLSVSAKSPHHRRNPPYPTPSTSSYYPTGTGTSVYSTGTSPYTYTPTRFSTSTITSSTSDPTPTVPTSTTSSTPRPTISPTSFKLQVNLLYANNDDTPPPFGGYATLLPGSIQYNNGAPILGYTTDLALATTFTLNSDSTLSVGPLIADMPYFTADGNLLFQTQAVITAGNFYKTYCVLDAASGGLGCSTNTGSYFTNGVLYTTSEAAPYSLVYGPVSRSYNVAYDLELLTIPL